MLTHTKFQEVDNNLQMCPMKTADLGDTCLLEQLTELTTFASPSKNSARNKEKKKKQWPLQSILRYTQMQ